MEIIGIVIVILIAAFVVLNETEFWMGLPTDFRKLKISSLSPDIRFENAEAKKAILMLHEFGGTPRSMEYVGKGLKSMGFEVFIPAFPGAAETMEDAQKSVKPNYRLWRNFALEQYKEICKKYDKVVIVGASIGGSIALDIASEKNTAIRKPFAVVTVSSPLVLTGNHFRKKFLRNMMLRLTGILSIIKKEVKTGVMPEEAKKILDFYGVEGNFVPSSYHSLRLGLRRLRGRLNEVSAPLLCFHAQDDTTIGIGNLDRITETVGSDIVFKRRFRLQNDPWTRQHRLCGHHWTRDKILWEIGSFVEFVEKTENQ